MEVFVDFKSYNIDFINYIKFSYKINDKGPIKILNSYAKNAVESKKDFIDPMPILMLASRAFKETLNSEESNLIEKSKALRNFSTLSALFTILISQNCKVDTVLKEHNKHAMYFTIYLNIYL